MKALLHLVVYRFLIRSLWMAFIATFGIQLFLTFLPPKRVTDPRLLQVTGTNPSALTTQWTTAKYFKWTGTVLSGNPQISDQGSAKWQVKEFKLRASNTLFLCGSAFLIALLMGIVIGGIKAIVDCETVTGKKTPLGKFLSSTPILILYILSSIPAYIIAYLLFILFKGDYNTATAVIALTLGSGIAMEVSRFTMNIQSRQLNAKYIETALICGLKTGGIIPLPGYVSWHAFRNSLITILPVTAFRLPLVVSSALVVEIVCDIPGLGESLLRALINQDAPMTLTIVLISVLFVQVCVFFADLLSYYLNPQPQASQQFRM